MAAFAKAATVLALLFATAAGDGGGLRRLDQPEADVAIQAQRHHALLLTTGTHETRLYLYSQDAADVSGRLLGRLSPGLTAYAEPPEAGAGAAAALRPLFEAAREAIPKLEHGRTRVFMFGTAGMRDLSRAAQQSLWDHIYGHLKGLGAENFPFLLRREDLEVITGEREGFFAGLAVNWVHHRMNGYAEPETCAEGAPENRRLLGAFDLGSTSAQLATPLKQAGCTTGEESGGKAMPRRLRESDFWSVSLKNYGADHVYERVEAAILQAANAPGGGANPCANAGAGPVAHRNGPLGLLAAAGDGDKCREVVARALWGEEDSKCLLDAGMCLLDGIAVARRVARSEFLAMRTAVTIMEALRRFSPAGLEGWPRPSLREIRASTDALCAQPWNALESQMTPKEAANESEWDGPLRLLPKLCLKASYISVLWRSMGFDLDARNVLFADQARGVAVDWTVGAAVEYFAKVSYRRRVRAKAPTDVASIAFNAVLGVLMVLTVYFVVLQAKFLYRWVGPRTFTQQDFAKKVDATIVKSEMDGASDAAGNAVGQKA